MRSVIWPGVSGGFRCGSARSPRRPCSRGQLSGRNVCPFGPGASGVLSVIGSTCLPRTSSSGAGVPPGPAPSNVLGSSSFRLSFERRDHRVAHRHGVGAGRQQVERGVLSRRPACPEATGLARIQILRAGMLQLIDQLVLGHRVLQVELHRRAAGELDVEHLALVHLDAEQDQAQRDGDRAERVEHPGECPSSRCSAAAACPTWGSVSGRLLRLRTPNLSIRMPKIVWVTNSAVNKLARMPMTSVMPKPFTSSVPNQIRKREVMNVVVLESRMALQRLVVGVAQGHAEREAAVLLFAQALEDQHVGVDGRADRQHDAGDAGQRERRVERGHHAQMISRFMTTAKKATTPAR